ncbi:hypothetical protein INR49_019649 [Caranx melampygus]|nr:hypothetical protein INR49_019649 [Caranx melampygus]
MWLWITIGLNFIATVQGYKNKPFPSACISMSPTHHAFSGELVSAQTSAPPFGITCKHGGGREPVTIILTGKATKFRGFLLEARLKSPNNNAVPVGKFILLDPRTTTHQECNGVPDSAVRHVNHVLKQSVQVNWTASEELTDVTFSICQLVSSPATTFLVL